MAKNLGIIGGGQLAQMICECASTKKINTIVLDPNENCSAKSSATKLINANYDDIMCIENSCDVITYEFENIDPHPLKFSNKIYQETLPLEIFSNREKEKQFCKNLGLKPVPYKKINSTKQLKDFIKVHGYPVVVKTNTLGYDGHGQTILKEGLIDISSEMIVEKYITILEEISIILFQNKNHDVVSLPVFSNIHHNNILKCSELAKNPKYDNLVTTLKEKLSMTQIFGILAIELFIDYNNKIYYNEAAPRPHNSGHLSIEACDKSQYELLIDTIFENKISDAKIVKDAFMLNILGQHYNKIPKTLLNDKNIYFHDYNKELRHNRKVAHITFLGSEAILKGKKLMGELYE